MRGITGTLVVLLAVGYFASRAGIPAVSRSGSEFGERVAQEDGWRRTAQGWEQCLAWSSPVKETVFRPSSFLVHPTTIAVLQLLVLLVTLRLDRSTRGTIRDDVTLPCAVAADPNSRCPEDA